MNTNIAIQTSQNVTVEYEVASVGERILAQLLDFLVYLAWLFLFIAIMKFSNGNEGDDLTAFIYFLPLLFYSLIMELTFNGQSLGKMVLNIRVVKIDGTPATLGSYLLRWLFRLVDIFLISPGVAVITIIANNKGQRLGDMAAGTCVIRLKRRVKLSDTMYNVTDANYQVIFPQAVNLSDDDIKIIKNVYRQAMQKKQFEMVDELAYKVQNTLGIRPLIGSEEFLRIIVKDYNHLMGQF